MNEEGVVVNGKRSRTGARRFVRIALTIPTVLLLFIAGALHLREVQAPLVDLLVSRFARTTRLDIQFESFEWRPFSSLALRGVKVGSAEKPVLECGEARLTYDPAFIPPGIVLTELHFHKPVLHLERDAKGRWVLPPGALVLRDDVSSAMQTGRRTPLPLVRIAGGVIEGRQANTTILKVADVSGVLSLSAEARETGSVFTFDLERWIGGAPGSIRDGKNPQSAGK